MGKIAKSRATWQNVGGKNRNTGGEGCKFPENTMRRYFIFSGSLLLLACPAIGVAKPPTGFLPEVRVKAPTRLDWEFAAAAFDAKPTLPPAYDSRKQRYQLFVPKNYDPDKTWPLVLFISPGDDPLGWRFWQKACEQSGLLFCAAYGAGNTVPVAPRARIVLDMFDDVRRHYRVDPEQTYLAGFSGGGRMACAIAFALPEYFAGAIPICGTSPLNKLPYLRQRVGARLSVAFVTGAADFNRKENEDYMAPFFNDLGIRSRLWVVPKMGHSIPGPKELAEVHAWLAEDVKRRRADAKTFPALAADPEEVRTAMQQADGLVKTAEAELKQPEHTWRAAALLEGVGQRWSDTPAASRAKKLLTNLNAAPAQARLLAEQKGAEEQKFGTAEAQALERMGLRRRAVEVWRQLAKQYPASEAGKKGAEEVKRLEAAIAATPKRASLGVSFKGETTLIGQVTSDSPAAKAGIQPGDVLLKFGTVRVARLTDLVKALQERKPGEEVRLEFQRGGQIMAATVQLGARAAPGDE